MQIDISTEHLLSITEAAKIFPGRPHHATLWRYVLRGVGGIKLDSCKIGGKRRTSREAIERFVERSTAAAAGEPIPARTSKQRQRDIERAEADLRAMGI
jgi:hypothetical protein